MSKRDSHAPGGGTRQAEEGFFHVQEPQSYVPWGGTLTAAERLGLDQPPNPQRGQQSTRPRPGIFKSPSPPGVL